MKNDRRLNGWVLISSIFGIIAGLALLIVGAGGAVFGYLKADELLKLQDLTFFINQEGLNNVQKLIFNGLLKTEFLFLILGAIIAVIGILVLVFAIFSLKFARKRRVVRHRVALFFFTLIPAAIAGGIATYLVLEFKTLTDMVKYVCYGVGGVFAFITLCNLLGLLFGRSEKFMSNDNGKYAFENSSNLRNARAEANSNVRDAQYQPNVAHQAQPVRPNPVMQQRPAQAGQVARPMPSGQARPQGARPMPQRPVQANRPMMQNGQPVRPNPMMQQRPIQPGQPARPMQANRPQINANAQSTARPVASRSANPVRPTQPVRPQAPQPKKYCIRCGKQLAPNETVCSMCGTKVVQ